MTNEELNTALYQKMFAEQEQYKQWLLTQPPDEILHHCYEFVVREDIVLALEEHFCSPRPPLRMFLENGKAGKPAIWIMFLNASKAAPTRCSGRIS